MDQKPIRILTAVAAYDGHDASVLALNRALLAGSVPVEVIYLGFNMTCEKIVMAALQEDVRAVAVSSYNGGHLHFFPHLVCALRARGLDDVLVFGGGGGTIVAQDAEALESAGVERIYGTGLSIDEVARDMTERVARRAVPSQRVAVPGPGMGAVELTTLLSLAEYGAVEVPQAQETTYCKTVVVAGDGGSGKSTMIDELVRRFLADFPDKRVAVLANDPTVATGRAATAFLADRVRMNHIYHERVWLRSLATGTPYAPLSPRLPQLAALLRLAGYELVLVETPGTGQTGIDLSALSPDLTVYVKTRESSGSPIQLQKDQLLHEADLVVLNKADLEGAESALAELRGALAQFGRDGNVFAATSKSARDPGVASLFEAICSRLGWNVGEAAEAGNGDVFGYAKKATLVPHRRRAYLAQIADKVREYDAWAAAQLRIAREAPHNPELLDAAAATLLERWQQEWQTTTTKVAERGGGQPEVETVNRLRLERIALPDPEDRVESLRFLLEEGLPGRFPFVTGIYPYRPPSAGQTLRQFAGLRGPEETNRRLHFLAQGVANPRLSIAFDGITLYGGDSDDDPGSIGKIGEGGVAIDSWEDMKLVLEGFEIPLISTSMTINGPAPIILAMYFVAAQEIELERAEREKGAPLSEAEREGVKLATVRELRGTVQADILKEIQAQNENLFQPDFAVKLLGDIQEWFVTHGVKKFYSLSISGYHIGEAGATPVQELAFTLANGFTYVENFLSRGMKIDDFAPNLSFFFKVSHEAEWLAYGAVVRKIWAIALRDVYCASERSQMLKFHTQTSGRALQAEEWDTLNPVRLTYHALLGLLANSNSLHVDSADEPMTTPAEKWVRQATMISNYLREEAEAFAVQNLLSGSYAFRALVREVQAQVLEEFDRLDQLGGVGPATEQGYQRRCIAESSARYERERRRVSPENPQPPRRKIVGYNAFALPDGDPQKYPSPSQLVRPGPSDWERQLARVRDFKERHAADAPEYLERLKQRALAEGNIFDELLETVRHATLGQIAKALMEVGGEYRKMV